MKKQKKDSLKLKEKIKEIKFSHKIAEHDAQVKIKKVMKLLATRHRVKIVIFYPNRRYFCCFYYDELLFLFLGVLLLV